MKDLKSIKKSLNIALNKTTLKPYELSWMAYDLACLKIYYNIPQDEYYHFREMLLKKIEESNTSDLVNILKNYVLKIIRSKYIEYEEYNKLYSLLDEIKSLELIGFQNGGDVDDGFLIELQLFCNSNTEKMKIIAKDRCESWKQDWFWYHQLI